MDQRCQVCHQYVKIYEYQNSCRSVKIIKKESQNVDISFTFIDF